MELTTVEKHIIHELKRLSNFWPNSLWIYTANGEFCVMRNKGDGTRAVKENHGIDPDYIVTTVNIPCDGGDW